MPALNWKEAAVVECLEVLPEGDDYATERIFTVERSGITLIISVWPYESVVQFVLKRTGAEIAMFDWVLYVRGLVEYKRYKNVEYLRFCKCLPTASRFSYRDYQANLFDEKEIPYDVTVQVRVKPDIQIFFERP